jgi:hypothetical protein
MTGLLDVIPCETALAETARFPAAVGKPPPWRAVEGEPVAETAGSSGGGTLLRTDAGFVGLGMES